MGIVVCLPALARLKSPSGVMFLYLSIDSIRLDLIQNQSLCNFLPMTNPFL